jgi:hypothetical protein
MVSPKKLKLPLFFSLQISYSVRKKTPKKILRNQRGQASVEYILVLLLMLFFAGKTSKAIIGFLDSGILRVGGALEKQLKTGRVQLNTWRN